MRRVIWLMLLLPALAGAQQFEFELQPEAFPVEISGWQPYCPWAGIPIMTTPEFCDINADGDLIISQVVMDIVGFSRIKARLPLPI